MFKKAIIFSPGQVRINKYFIYGVLLLLSFSPLYPKLWKAFTYTKTTGEVVSIDRYDFANTYGNMRSDYAPKVNFIAGADTFTCFASSNELSFARVHNQVPVIYDPHNKQHAYVFTFISFWNGSLAFPITLAVIFSLLFLGVSTIPKYIKLSLRLAHKPASEYFKPGLLKRLIFIEDRKLSISKYLIYFILMFILLLPLTKKVWYALTFSRTNGFVNTFIVRHTTGRRARTYYYPEVEYTVGKHRYICYGSSFQHDVVRVLDSLTVIYSPSNPQRGYLYTTLAYWMPPLMYIIPFSLMLTLACFGLSTIPRYFVLKL